MGPGRAMSDKPLDSQADIIVVGGGAIGLSVAYHLGQLGYRNVLVLERNTLTSGTSWHAAGIVGPLRGSQNLTQLAKYAVTLFQELEKETGQATGYRQTGGLWLAQHPHRLIEFKRMAAMGRMNSLGVEMLSAKQIEQRIPLVNVEDLVGGLWVAEDGQVNPVDLCMAYAKGARSFGVHIREHSEVTGFTVHNDAVQSVLLQDGERLSCQVVINCAGVWAREIGLLAGVGVPLQAVEHMYVVTEPMQPQIPSCPVIRDMDSGIYVKEDAGKLVIGTFESDARLWDPSQVDSEAAFLMFDEDWDHVEPMLKASMRRLPCLERMGLSQFVNGPESFTPDTRQIMGRDPRIGNFYVAAGFNSIGIMSSAGVGRTMAQWVVHGDVALDMWEVDIARFEPADNELGFLRQRILESVHNQFQMHWPFKQYRTGRDRKRSAWHHVLHRHGAVFGAPSGWERPLWFALEGEQTHIQYSHAAQNWWSMAQRESIMLMNHGALFDLSPFTKIQIQGEPSCRRLQWLCTNDIDVPVGRVVYTLMLNPAGGIEGECTVTRLAEHRFLVISAAATRTKDFYWIKRHLAPANGLEISDRTDDYLVLGVMGPKAAVLLNAVSDDPVFGHSFKFGSSKLVNIQQVEVRASRLSYVGESGWELLIPVDGGVRVIETVIGKMDQYQMGLAGHFCVECCRLEKGYLHWGQDISREENPYQAGLGFAVKRRKPGGFIGLDALNETVKEPLDRYLLLFEVDATRPLLLHDERILCDGKWVGRTTSGGLGFRTGKALSLGYVIAQGQSRAALSQRNFEIEVADERYPMRPLVQCPYDPAGHRMRT